MFYIGQEKAYFIINNLFQLNADFNLFTPFEKTMTLLTFNIFYILSIFVLLYFLYKGITRFFKYLF